MSIATQQTELYVHDTTGGTPKVAQIGCPTSISGAGSTNESIETTCLDDTSREYMPGLSTPGEVSFDIRYDPAEQSHTLLETLREQRVTTEWGIGFSDGSQKPTYASNKLSFSGRSGITFQGFVTSLEFDFSMNDAVSASVGIQITGDINVSAKS